MSTISVRLPESLHKGLREIAEAEGISMNQFVVTAVAEKLAALRTEAYLQERAARGSRAKYEAALARVPDVEPEAYDCLAES
jgi:hypothetical protein